MAEPTPAAAAAESIRPQKQMVTSELRDWILAQVAAGHTPEAVLEAMKQSGWNEDTALDALETTLAREIAGETSGGAPGTPERPSLGERISRRGETLPPAVPVPGSALDLRRARIDAGDRTVEILTSLHTPRIVVLGGLLSESECDELVALASARLIRSETIDTQTGGNAVNAARTSDGMFFGPAEFPICARIEARLARLLDWPAENGEGLQILRYGPGAEYKPHYDWFDPADAGTERIVARGGQRVASIVCYLSSPEQGGGTVFPDVGLEVGAVKGNAVFFSYDRPHAITRTLHGGAPVQKGEKWVATKWLRERKFE
jgi:prolyl 4-hydroxylase